MIGWLDCSSGASGDMLLGALVGAGVPVETIDAAVQAVAPEPIRVSADAGTMTITPDGRTLYVAGADTITPISTATNTPGQPIPVAADDVPARADDIAITPDGKTLYVAARHGVVPISTATNIPGKPIRLPDYRGVPSLWITP